MSDPALSLLNIFELDDPEGTRFLVCFLEPVLAGARGIDSRAIVGEFTPKDDGNFDPETFQLNPEFITAFIDYMNNEGITSPEILMQARTNPGQHLGLIDPRNNDTETEPPATDLLGFFAVDEDGLPVKESFQYNADHVLFDPEKGPSGILSDRHFYEWLHSATEVDDEDEEGGLYDGIMDDGDDED